MNRFFKPFSGLLARWLEIFELTRTPLVSVTFPLPAGLPGTKIVDFLQQRQHPTRPYLPWASLKRLRAPCLGARVTALSCGAAAGRVSRGGKRGLQPFSSTPRGFVALCVRKAHALDDHRTLSPCEEARTRLSELAPWGKRGKGSETTRLGGTRAFIHLPGLGARASAVLAPAGRSLRAKQESFLLRQVFARRLWNLHVV